MGIWTLQNVTAICSPFETKELFGTNFIATFRLRYQQSMFTPFQEVPRLDWSEVIMMNEHHKMETWRFKTNMYEHNPTSKTLEIWSKRYVEAYNHANGMVWRGKGHSKLLDNNGVPVQRTALATKHDGPGKADAIRNYLKSFGGILEIQIHDIPSINKPKPGDTPVHKERLLLFDCGVMGGGPRVKAFQYLVVSSGSPQSDWQRQTGLGWAISGLKTSGMKSVQAPEQVSMQRQPVFFPGECW